MGPGAVDQEIGCKGPCREPVVCGDVSLGLVMIRGKICGKVIAKGYAILWFGAQFPKVGNSTQHALAAVVIYDDKFYSVFVLLAGNMQME